MKYMDVGADPDLQAALTAHGTNHEVFEPGEFVFKQGSKCNGVFLVTSGLVRVFLPSADSTATIERIATPGCVLGLPSTVSGEPYSLTAEAMQRTQADHISRASITKLMQRDTASAIKLLGLLSGEVRTLRTEMAKEHGVRRRSEVSATAR
jgi:CRP-like cAMP-binding protein